MSKPRAEAGAPRHYTRIVERYAGLLERPEHRLRFLNLTLGRQLEREERWHQALRRFQFIEGTRLYRYLLELQFHRAVCEELRLHLPDEERRFHALSGARLFFHLYRARHLLFVAALAILAVLLWKAAALVPRSAARIQSISRPSPVSVAPIEASLLPAFDPEKVFLVEATADFERYSNGGRILKKHETVHHPRAYYRFARSAATPAEVRTEPIGILYHSTESDILPFTAERTGSIQQTSEELLAYIHRHRSYHYLIDRFGEIHRIVRDADAANHAGHSIWSDGSYFYVGLNESFIGVSFESTSAIDGQLTEAQLYAGRLLTGILRSRYQIAASACTAHGLVSVDPERMTIAHHHDWARNFPFAAFGLPDQYQALPSSMTEYGFTWDEEVLDKLGGNVWGGAAAAAQEFARRATREGLEVEALRRRLVSEYRKQMGLSRALHATPPAEEAGAAGLAP